MLFIIFSHDLCGMEERSVKWLKFLEREIFRQAVKDAGIEDTIKKIDQGNPITIVIEAYPPKNKDLLVKMIFEAIDQKEANSEFLTEDGIVSSNRLGDYTTYVREVNKNGYHAVCTSVFTDMEILKNELNSMISHI
jgi:hypothetical protein